MKTVKKIMIQGDTTTIKIPEFAPILSAGVEFGEIYVYVLWEDNIQEKESVTIHCYYNDETLVTNFGKFISTISTPSGQKHIFEVRGTSRFDDTVFEVRNA